MSDAIGHAADGHEQQLVLTVHASNAPGTLEIMAFRFPLGTAQNLANTELLGTLTGAN